MPPVTLILFWTFAGLAITAAALCIIQKSPMASALWLIVTLFALAALFVLLDAQFLGVLLLWILDRGRVVSGSSTRGRAAWKRDAVSHMGGD